MYSTLVKAPVLVMQSEGTNVAGAVVAIHNVPERRRR